MIAGRAVRTVCARLAEFPYATLIGLLGVNGAVTFFTQPERVVPHALQRPFDYAWAALYGVGGLLILVGIASRRANIEAAGCLAFAGGAAINIVVTSVLLGLTAWNSILLLALFVGASLIRAMHIAQGRVLVLVRDVDNTFMRYH